MSGGKCQLFTKVFLDLLCNNCCLPVLIRIASIRLLHTTYNFILKLENFPKYLLSSYQKNFVGTKKHVRIQSKWAIGIRVIEVLLWMSCNIRKWSLRHVFAQIGQNPHYSSIYSTILDDWVMEQWKAWSDCEDAQTDLWINCPYIC